MPTLKFQTTLVDGKPKIFFEKEVVEQQKRKFSYLSRDLRFPLRDKVQEESDWQQQQEDQSSKSVGEQRQPLKTESKKIVTSTGMNRSGEPTVTLTKDQLAAILTSVQQTTKSPRDRNNRLNRVYTQESHRDDRASDESDTTAQENRVPQRLKQKKETAAKKGPNTKDTVKQTDVKGSPSHKPENVLGLLRHVPQKTKKIPQKSDASHSKEKKKGDDKMREKRRRGGEDTEMDDVLDDDTIQAVMQKVIEENKDKLSEEEMVDLLAQIYLHAKRTKKHAVKENSDDDNRSKYSEDRRSRSRHYDNDDDVTRNRRLRFQDEEKRRYGDDSDDEDDRRVRYRRRHRDDSEDDEDFDRSPRRRFRRRDRSKERTRSDEKIRERRADLEETKKREKVRSGSRKMEEIEKDLDRSDKEVMVSILPPPALSITEKKKLQWERERHELSKITSYDPWGRPGAGAPPLSTEQLSTSPRVTTKELERRRWVAELDLQREEAAKARAQGSPRRRNRSAEEDRNTVASIAIDMPVRGNDTGRQSGHRGGIESDGEIGVGNSSFTEQQFARGRGLASLDETTKDLDIKRKKHLDHQEAIRLQVEEHKLQKTLERERRIQEEMEEERRLSKERQAMQKQFEEESNRQKRKEEEMARRVAVLKETLTAAEEGARIEKQRRRLARLEQGGHDTSYLRASHDAQQTARSGGQMGTNRMDHGDPSEMGEGSEWATPRQRANPLPQVTDFVGFSSLNDPFRRPFEMQNKHESVQTDDSLLVSLVMDGEIGKRGEPNATYNLSSLVAPGPHPQLYHHTSHQGLGEDTMRSKGWSHQQTSHRGGLHLQGIGEDTKRSKMGSHTQTNFPGEERSLQLDPITKARLEMKERKGPHLGIHQRPEWGSKIPAGGRHVKKQSERDPFYNTEREDVRRERQEARKEALLAQVRANASIIPGEEGIVETRRSGLKRTQRHAACAPKQSTIMEEPENSSRSNLGARNRQRSYSPPTVRHQFNEHRVGTNGGYSAPHSPALWPTASPTVRQAGVPFLVRTTDVLDPAVADRPLPHSREASARNLARKSYLKGLNPAQYGEYMDNIDDRRVESILPAKSTRDPIYNPGLVTNRPTPRQDAIMRQLSDIRHGLLQKQKEIETSLSMTEAMG